MPKYTFTFSMTIYGERTIKADNLEDAYNAFYGTKPHSVKRCLYPRYKGPDWGNQDLIVNAVNGDWGSGWMRVLGQDEEYYGTKTESEWRKEMREERKRMKEWRKRNPKTSRTPIQQSA